MAAMARLALGVALAVAGARGVAAQDGGREFPRGLPTPMEQALIIQRETEQMETEQRMRAATTQLMTIVGAVRSLAARAGDYGRITERDVAASRQLSVFYVLGPAAAPVGLTSAFLSPVLVRPAEANRQFQVTMTGIPRAECQRLAHFNMRDIIPEAMAVGVGADIAAAAARVESRLASGLGQPYAAAEAATACKVHGNVLAWRFN